MNVVRSIESIKVPFDLVEDRLESLLASEIENLLELHVHLIASHIVQSKPNIKQLVGWRFLH